MVLVAVSGNRLLVSESAAEGRGLGGLLRGRTKSRELADVALNPVRWSDEDETHANLATSEEHYKRALLPRVEGERTIAGTKRWLKTIFFKVSEVFILQSQ